ncbi:hypothetical protein BDR03DRAFT_741162 [Suillus americanus]|nr:hypothetical protein BDR03DRAFT_741162 [Suillus americanus]
MAYLATLCWTLWLGLRLSKTAPGCEWLKWICLQTRDCTPAVAGLKPEGRGFNSRTNHQGVLVGSNAFEVLLLVDSGNMLECQVRSKFVNSGSIYYHGCGGLEATTCRLSHNLKLVLRSGTTEEVINQSWSVFR